MNEYLSAILSFCSGLALFLYGMRFMTDQLEYASGKSIKKYFGKLSGGVFSGFIFGTLISVLIQSSSATTVMVIGLVNANILTLTSACGVIIGANLGTTITSWILSLSSIEASSLSLQIISPEFFAPILALSSIFVRLFSRKSRIYDIAGLTLGFSVLMIGMNLMTSSLIPFENTENFSRILNHLSSPIVAFLVGIITSALIQSSSASVGVLQAFSVTGLVPYSMVVPMVMGQNIGTCATALISSVGAGKNAKRAAFIHLYYNVIGAALISVIFYAAVLSLNIDFLSTDATPTGIALTHTLFNLISTFLLLPFAKQLEKLSILTFPEKKNSGFPYNENEKLLDERFLKTPTLALGICKEVFDKLYLDVFSNIKLAMSLANCGRNKRIDLSSFTNSYDEQISLKNTLQEYLLKFNSQNLSLSDSRELCRLISSLEGIERICESYHKIPTILSQIRKNSKTDALVKSENMEMLFSAICEMYEISSRTTIQKEPSTAHRTLPLLRLVEAISAELKIRHTSKIISRDAPSYDIESGLLFSELIASFEKIAASIYHISTCVIKSHFGGSAFEMREYLQSYEKSAEFEVVYYNFRKKYSLS